MCRLTRFATSPLDEREPEEARWLAALGNVNSRPRYPER